jgi:hypothetical protein
VVVVDLVVVFEGVGVEVDIVCDGIVVVVVVVKDVGDSVDLCWISELL